jgi:hypothetical protein
MYFKCRKCATCNELSHQSNCHMLELWTNVISCCHATATNKVAPNVFNYKDIIRDWSHVRVLDGHVKSQSFSEAISIVANCPRHDAVAALKRVEAAAHWWDIVGGIVFLLPALLLPDAACWVVRRIL